MNGAALRAANRDFVVLCQELELLGGETIGIGGSFFKASASRTRITTKKTLEAELKTIEHDLEAYTQTLDANDDQEQHLGHRCGEDLVLAEKLEALKERQARQQVQLKPLKDSSETQHFRTDPDARALNKGKQQVTGYNVQSVYLPRRRGIAPARSAASEERHPAHPLPPPGQSVPGLPTRGGVFAGLPAVHAQLIEAHRHRMAESGPKRMRQRAGLVKYPFGTLKRWFGWDHLLVRASARCEGR